MSFESCRRSAATYAATRPAGADERDETIRVSLTINLQCAMQRLFTDRYLPRTGQMAFPMTRSPRIADICGPTRLPRHLGSMPQRRRTVQRARCCAAPPAISPIVGIRRASFHAARPMVQRVAGQRRCGPRATPADVEARRDAPAAPSSPMRRPVAARPMRAAPCGAAIAAPARTSRVGRQVGHRAAHAIDDRRSIRRAAARCGGGRYPDTFDYRG